MTSCYKQWVDKELNWTEYQQCKAAAGSPMTVVVDKNTEASKVAEFLDAGSNVEIAGDGQSGGGNIPVDSSNYAKVLDGLSTRGPQGIQGIQGEPGVAGATGFSGLPGLQGESGTTLKLLGVPVAVLALGVGAYALIRRKR